MVHLPTALFSLSYIRDSSNRCSHYAPLRGATVVTRTVTEGAAEFQSTRPMRGATPMAIHRSLPMPFQSTRPARGATCRRQLCPGRQRHFNPRAPRGARPHRPGLPAVHDVFQSTRPMRGATYNGNQTMLPDSHFNPRAPCGARLFPPVRAGHNDIISIHAPHAGRDILSLRHKGMPVIFQSTRPMRGATHGILAHILLAILYFNPRAPCGARPWRCSTIRLSLLNFNPRAPCGARRLRKSK